MRGRSEVDGVTEYAGWGEYPGNMGDLVGVDHGIVRDTVIAIEDKGVQVMGDIREIGVVPTFKHEIGDIFNSAKESRVVWAVASALATAGAMKVVCDLRRPQQVQAQ